MPPHETIPKRRRRFRLIVITPALALIALMCWAIASPIGSSPDDDFHLTSVWCGLGERPGICESVPGKPQERAVPPLALEASDCYKTKPDRSAGCISKTVDNHGRLVATDRGNFAGSYPPVYYAAMSVLVTPNVALSVILMRIVNVLLFVLITTALFVLLPPRRRWTLVWMWSIAIVPLAAFLIASNNPSGWAIISGGSLWIALIGYFESRGRRKLLLGAMAALTATMGAGARADAAVYAVIAMLLAVILTFKLTRRYVLSCILPATLALLAFVFYRMAGQAASVSYGLNSNHVDAPTQAGSHVSVIWNNLLNLPSLWAGSLGTWPLGWLDTPLPAVVWVACMFVFAAATFTGLISLSNRKVWALAVVSGALIAVPSWILFQSRAQVGQEVQPRYILPLVIMFAGVVLLQVGSRRIRFTRLQVWVAIAALAIANGIALYTNLRRYLTGLSAGGVDLDRGVQWWWAGPISPMAVFLIGTLAFGTAIAIALRAVTNESSERLDKRSLSGAIEPTSVSRP